MPSMSIQTVFPSIIYRSRVTGARTLNSKLINEINHLEIEDGAGQRWSEERYPGGYTSYGSLHRLHEISPTFHALDLALRPHIKAYAKSLGLSGARKLDMTDCWANVMRKGVHHGWHLHPQAVISGTYYLKTPRGAAPLKFEDPRLDRLMAAPLSPSRQRALWLEVPARESWVVLFESWMRHEVPINQSTSPRVSVSFNYSFF
jgi:uncharacterized protein (TIGR02466 family)